MSNLVEMKDEIVELIIQKNLINLARDYIWLRNKNIIPINEFVYEYLKPLNFLIKVDNTFVKKVQPLLIKMNNDEIKKIKKVINEDINYGDLCKKLNYIYNLISNDKLRKNFFDIVYKNYKDYEYNMTKLEILSQNKNVNTFYNSNTPNINNIL